MDSRQIHSGPVGTGRELNELFKLTLQGWCSASL